MKPFSAIGKVGIVLLLLNEIRGIVVVLSVIAAWSHGGKAVPPTGVGASAGSMPPEMSAPREARVAPPPRR